MASNNMYRVGEYVYFEKFPGAPYLVRKIVELNKTITGTVEAKVQCFYRRRDLSTKLSDFADQFYQDFKQPSIADCSTKPSLLSSNKINLLKNRELFMSYQLETLPATQIRGKCSVEYYHCRDAHELHTDNINNSKQSDGVTPKIEKMEVADQKVEMRVNLNDAVARREKEDDSDEQAEESDEEAVNGLSKTYLSVAQMEKLLEADNSFFCQLVYDVFAERLVKARRSVRIGAQFQAKIPDLVMTSHHDDYCNEHNDDDDDDNVNEGCKKEKREKRTVQQAKPMATMANRERSIWSSESASRKLSERALAEFLVLARSVRTVSFHDSQPLLRNAVQSASRDSHLQLALNTLHSAHYSPIVALAALFNHQSKSGALTATSAADVRDELNAWSAPEVQLFETALAHCTGGCATADLSDSAATATPNGNAAMAGGGGGGGPGFLELLRHTLPWKSRAECVHFYYASKRVRHFAQIYATRKHRRRKTDNVEQRLRQVYIPNYAGGSPGAAAVSASSAAAASAITSLGGLNTAASAASCVGGAASGGGGGVGSGMIACDGCRFSAPASAPVWFNWGPSTLQCKLCSQCWTYWKKYGSLKNASGVASNGGSVPEREIKSSPSTKPQPAHPPPHSSTHSSTHSALSALHRTVHSAQSAAAESSANNDNKKIGFMFQASASLRLCRRLFFLRNRASSAVLSSLHDRNSNSNNSDQPSLQCESNGDAAAALSSLAPSLKRRFGSIRAGAVGAGKVPTDALSITDLKRLYDKVKSGGDGRTEIESNLERSNAADLLQQWNALKRMRFRTRSPPARQVG